MPAQLWNRSGTSNSATEPDAPGTKIRRRPSRLSWPHPKRWPSNLPSLASAAAVPAAGDVFRTSLARGGAGQRCVEGARLLIALNRERDLIARKGAPHLGIGGAVHLDHYGFFDISARSAEVFDQKNESPDLPAGINGSISAVRPSFSHMRLGARARARQIACSRNDSGHLTRDVAREREDLRPGPFRDHRGRRRDGFHRRRAAGES